MCMAAGVIRSIEWYRNWASEFVPGVRSDKNRREDAKTRASFVASCLLMARNKILPSLCLRGRSLVMRYCIFIPAALITRSHFAISRCV